MAKSNNGRKPTAKSVAKPVNLAEQGGRYAPMKPVADLWFGQTDCKPRNFDWSQGYGETWESHEASRCEECGAIIIGNGGEKHCDVTVWGEDGEEAERSECQGYIPEGSGPMMNYFYPLERFRMDSDEAARALVDLPLCLVEFIGDDVDDENRYALALTGGGMDLSWEICEAFMRLGYLPPVHFAADLPQMADRGKSERDRWIIAGCRRALQGTKDQVGRALRRLRETFPAKSEKGGE